MGNIVLIGINEVGKTEKGEFLAKILNWEYLDTNQLIVERYNMSIDNLFAKYGEDYFRNVESKIVKEVSNLNNTVISTNIEVVINSNNVENLKNNGYIFLLTDRDLENLYEEREKSCLLASDFIFNTDNKSIKQVCREILIEHDRCSRLFSSCGK